MKYRAALVDLPTYLLFSMFPQRVGRALGVFKLMAEFASALGGFCWSWVEFGIAVGAGGAV